MMAKQERDRAAFPQPSRGSRSEPPKARTPSEREPGRAAPSAKRYRVLVVDDHEAFRRTLCAFIGLDEKWEVCGHAVNGREGAEQALRLRPDVVLMDISMPEMDGIAACRVLRRDLPAVPIIMLSADDSPETIDASMKAGVSGYLVKRDLDRDLFRALETVVKGGRFLNEASK